MLLPELLMYCDDKGRYFLKVKGGGEPWQFGRIKEAFDAAARLYPKAPILVYDAVGRVVMDTAVLSDSGSVALAAAVENLVHGH